MTSPYACARCRERLPWYAAGTLPPAERAEVEEHLAGCAACRREVALWRAVGSALDGMGETAPEAPVAALEDTTWRGVQSRIEADGWVSESGLKERFLMDENTGSIVSAPSMSSHGSAGPSRRQPFVALAAAVMIIALGVTLFGVYAARLRSGGPSTTTAAAACAPSQLKASLPAHAILNDLSMVSGTDGWAVGEIRDTSATGAAAQPRSLLLRFQHCTWSETGQSISSAALFSVVMNSASDGWALGATMTATTVAGSPADHAFMLHYTGGSWRRVDLNSGHGLLNAILRMRSQNDGWIALTVQNIGTMLYHYQGSAWTPVATPGALQPLMSGTIVDLATNRPNDVWIAGNATNGSMTIGHYSAGQWSSWELSSPPPGEVGPTVDAIRATSPQDVWMFGRNGSQTQAGYNAAPYIMRYNGTNWSQVHVGLKSPATDVQFWSTTVTQPDGSFLALGSVSPPTNKALDSSTFRTLVLRCSATGCQQQTFPLRDVSYVYAVSLYAPTQGFAIGNIANGVTPHSTTFLLFYDAGKWTRVPE